jgi:lipopolysaccharide/colanic/teichoic acid biosynthesis glycosyltransferase
VGGVTSRWIRSGAGKRAVDVLLAGPALLILSPIVALMWLAVRTKLGKPALFRQIRAGRNANPIVVPKFRTMTNDVDADGNLLPDELRLTPFGARVRALSLDELPQFLTVLKGEMSLVGPRPLPTAYVDRYSAEQLRRLDAKPGITGWAQVNGRNSTSWAERLSLDVWYVDNASLWLDLKILAMTVKTAARREGVAAPEHVTMHEFTGEP